MWAEKHDMEDYAKRAKHFSWEYVCKNLGMSREEIKRDLRKYFDKLEKTWLTVIKYPYKEEEVDRHYRMYRGLRTEMDRLLEDVGYPYVFCHMSPRTGDLRVIQFRDIDGGGTRSFSVNWGNYAVQQKTREPLKYAQVKGTHGLSYSSLLAGFVYPQQRDTIEKMANTRGMGLSASIHDEIRHVSSWTQKLLTPQVADMIISREWFFRKNIHRDWYEFVEKLPTPKVGRSISGVVERFYNHYQG
jgi:hypothetical protein